MSTKHSKMTAEVRTVIGKQVRQLRRAGLIPAVLYGPHDPIHLQLNSLQTTLILRDADSNAVIDLDINGTVYSALVRDLQRHATRRDILHIDFLEVNLNVVVEAEVHLVLRGELPFEERLSGTAVQLLQHVQIEAKPDDLVSELVVDISLLKTPEDVLMVSDLVAPEGVTILTEGDIAVAKFEFDRAAVSSGEADADVATPAA